MCIRLFPIKIVYNKYQEKLLFFVLLKDYESLNCLCKIYHEKFLKKKSVDWSRLYKINTYNVDAMRSYVVILTKRVI